MPLHTAMTYKTKQMFGIENRYGTIPVPSEVIHTSFTASVAANISADLPLFLYMAKQVSSRDGKALHILYGLYCWTLALVLLQIRYGVVCHHQSIPVYLNSVISKSLQADHWRVHRPVNKVLRARWTNEHDVAHLKAKSVPMNLIYSESAQ